MVVISVIAAERGKIPVLLLSFTPSTCCIEIPVHYICTCLGRFSLEGHGVLHMQEKLLGVLF